MTKLNIKGNKIAITDAMKEHVSKKFEKTMDSFLDQIISLDVNYSKNGNSTDAFKLTATVSVKGNSFHAEEVGDNGDDFYGMVDKLALDIERQLQKRKTRFESEKKKADSIKRHSVSDEDE